MELKIGYKKTDAGVIPQDWDVDLIGDLCECKSGTTPARALLDRYYRNGSIAWVKTMDLNNGAINATSEYVTDTAIEETSLKLFPVGVVLVAMYGGFQQIGRTGLLRIPATVNQAITAIRINDNRLLPEYLLATLNHRVSHWRAVASSSRKDPNITGNDVRLFPIGYPVAGEQKNIAEALSDMDVLLEGLERLIAKKRDLKQAAMQQLLTGQTRLPGFAGEWQPKTLGDLGTFLKGKGVKKDDTQTGSIPCIRYGEIYTHHNDYIKDFASWVSPEVAATATRLQKGDLLFAGSGETKEEIGKCVAFASDIEAYAGGDIVILRAADVDPIFMGYYCNTQAVNAQKASKGQGDAVVHISAAALASVRLVLPRTPEQSAIAALLVTMDAELELLQSRLAKTRDLKQAMMQELLTGRTRLVAAEEMICA